MLYQLSYTPIQMNRISSIRILKILRTFKIKQNTKFRLLRKEVIQPHLPIRLPCYDFTPIIDPTFGSYSPTSGITNSHGVTGGVYKARERIHRGMLIRDY